MCDCHRQIRIEIPVEIHEEMRAVGRQKRMTLTDIVVTAVREWFNSAKDARQLTIPGSDAASSHSTEVQHENP